MKDHLAPGDPFLREKILKNASHYCGRPFTLANPNETEYQTWTFYHCLFFALTIITTVGYGNINPQTNIGRLFVIFYAVVGLPMNGILFARFGQLYWDLVKAVKETFCRQYFLKFINFQFNHIHDRCKLFSDKIRLMLVIRWLIFLFPGFLLFVLLPGLVFSHFEKWTYGISIYYAFVTLTTIGFGDYAATFESESAIAINEWYYFYQVFVLIWFFLGLGYMIMITQYLIGHYDKSNFNQLDFEQPMSAKEELLKFGRSFKEDIKAINQVLFVFCRCSCSCCNCCTRKRALPMPDPVPSTNNTTTSITLKRTRSSPEIQNTTAM